MKKTFWIAGISFLGAFILPIILYQEWSFLQWADSLFIVGLALLIVGFSMVLIEGQFFVAFIKSTKHFFKTISKKEQVIQEIERKKESASGYKKHFPSSKIYIVFGFIFCFFSLLFSTLIVYFGR